MNLKALQYIMGHSDITMAPALFGDAKGCGLEDYDLTSFGDLLNIF